MKTSKILAITILAIGTGAIASTATFQDKPKESPAGVDTGSLAPQFDAGGLQRWMDACKPDFHHAKLADWIGKWDTETKVWMAGPDAPPMSSPGTAECSWLMENRWLKTESSGEMDFGAGKMMVKGFGLMGFDRYKNKYVGSWCDSTTTCLLRFEGNFDRTDKNLMLFGSMDEPMNNEHDKCVRYVWRLVSKDKLVFEIHDMPIGEHGNKVVEITYTRKK